MMLSFTFAGKDSFIDYGIIISSRPAIPAPQRRVSYIEVPGRDSSLRYDEGTYEDITLTAECTVKGGNIMERLDDIKAWLYSAGESDLIFSFQQYKKYRAQVVNAIDFKQGYKITSKFVIVFNCRPFKYTVNNDLVTISTGSGTNLVNQGTVMSRPIIKVYCTGNGSFKINNQEVFLAGISATFIALDSELEEAYSNNNGTLVNLNNSVSGEFPVLSIGNNTITYKGGVTKLEITPNWRWL